MLLNPTQVHKPQTLKELCSLWGQIEHAKILAGGTFLMNSLKLMKRKGMKTPDHVISLQDIPDLEGVERGPDQSLIIRSMTRISDLGRSPWLKDNFAVLNTVCKNISTMPIRNMATVGGNLTCRYTWTEMGAVMIALKAQLHFIDREGNDHEISAEDFFAGSARTDKILTHVQIPFAPDIRTAYRRVKKTMHVDVPFLTTCVSGKIESQQWTQLRIVINNGVSFAQRDKRMEEFLRGKNVSIETIHQALDHRDDSLYDKRSDDYKKHMFRVCLCECLSELAGLPEEVVL